MEVRQIRLEGLTGLLEEDDPRGILLLDPSEGAEMYFKYQGSLCIAYLPGEITRESQIRRARHSVKTGEALVMSLGTGSQDLMSFFHPSSFPEELLNRDLLSTEILDPLKASTDESLYCHSKYCFVVLLNTYEVPNWAQRLIEAGRLRTIKVV